MTPILTPAISTVLLRTQSDEKLVALVQAGHERAFEALCDRHRPALARALRRIMPPSRVDDALQQTFLSAWTALSGGTEVRALVPWLHRIARNAAATALARPGYDHAELEEALHLTPGPEEDLERRDVVRRTLKGVAALPERQREALLAVAVEGRPHAQVAAELGLSEPAVRQLVHRARTSLRTAVGAIVPTPLISWALTAGGHVATADGIAGAALGAGGTGALATALKLGAVVAVVSTPVVHHEVSVSRHHVATPPAVASVAGPGTAAASAGTRAAARLRAAGPGAGASVPASSPGGAGRTAARPGATVATRARAHLPGGANAPSARPAATRPPAAAARPVTATLPGQAGLPAGSNRQRLTAAQWLALLAMQQKTLQARRAAAGTTMTYPTVTGRHHPSGDRWPTGGGTTTAPAPAPSPTGTTAGSTTATAPAPATTTSTAAPTTTDTTTTTAPAAATTDATAAPSVTTAP